MERDDKLSDLLPKPPLPRPDRREAAISEAMRRLDGEGEARPSAPRPAREGRSWWGRPQLGAVLATGLIALIALPIWTTRDRHPELANPTARSETAPVLRGSDRGPQAEPASSPLPRIAAAPSGIAREAPQAPAPEQRMAESAEFAPEPPEAAKPGGAMSAADQGDIVTTAGRSPAMAPPPIAMINPVAPPPPPAPAPATAAKAAASGGGDNLVVTARRREERLQDVPVSVSAPAAAESAVQASRPRPSRQAAAEPKRSQARASSRSGDWNACTVNDPSRSLARCGTAGPLADGLTKAWRGDIDGAIAAFDAAIAASPQSGAAYLNRGLAYDRKGDRRRALADLDRAVQQAPNSARARYSRSIVLGRSGDKARAEADAARAVELDPSYASVIR